MKQKEMRRTNTNKKKPGIIGIAMLFVGGMTILSNALLPYFYPLYFVPLPDPVVPIIVVFALFCFGYGFMCLSLRKVYNKTQEVLSYEY